MKMTSEIILCHYGSIEVVKRDLIINLLSDQCHETYRYEERVEGVHQRISIP